MSYAAQKCDYANIIQGTVVAAAEAAGKEEGDVA
jgi:hypothetical protein